MIGLEINDAGLLAAGANGELLELEPGALASPGVALRAEGRLKVGRAAEKHCRRMPRQTNHQFWHRLAGDPLQDPAFAGLTNADLAHAHLSSIWQRISPVCDALLVAVPDVYTEQQLELLAGIMNALAMPVRGFVSLPLAALPPDAPAEVLLHLDLGLHRVLLTLMDVRGPAAVIETAAIDGPGLEALRTAWMQVIADQFVRRTRFDPFHAADTEQTLYDQLPGLIAALESAEDVAVEMTTSTSVHRIRLHRKAIEDALVPLLDAVQREIHLRPNAFWGSHPLGTIYVSHRGSRLPGFCRRLEAATGTRVRPLAEGAAAQGLLAFANAFSTHRARPGIRFINRQSGPQRPSPPVDTANPSMPATHLLYRSRGYRVSERPLIIGREIPTGSPGIQIHGRTEGVSRRHCSVVRQVDHLVLTDTSTYGTFVDDVKVAGEITLAVGQTIRVGTPGEQLQVIACLDNDETSAA